MQQFLLLYADLYLNTFFFTYYFLSMINYNFPIGLIFQEAGGHFLKLVSLLVRCAVISNVKAVCLELIYSWVESCTFQKASCPRIYNFLHWICTIINFKGAYNFTGYIVSPMPKILICQGFVHTRYRLMENRIFWSNNAGKITMKRLVQLVIKVVSRKTE